MCLGFFIWKTQIMVESYHKQLSAEITIYHKHSDLLTKIFKHLVIIFIVWYCWLLTATKNKISSFEYNYEWQFFHDFSSDITTSTRLNCLANDFLSCLVTPLSWVLVNHHARFSHLYTAHMQSVVKKRKWTQDNYFPISIFCKIAITQNLTKSIRNVMNIDDILWKIKEVYGKIITPKGMIIKFR